MWRDGAEHIIEQLFQGMNVPPAFVAVGAALVVALFANWLWPWSRHLGATLAIRTQWVIVVVVPLTALAGFLAVQWLMTGMSEAKKSKSLYLRGGNIPIITVEV